MQIQDEVCSRSLGSVVYFLWGPTSGLTASGVATHHWLRQQRQDHLEGMPPWTPHFLSDETLKLFILTIKDPWKVPKTNWKVCIHEPFHTTLWRTYTILPLYHQNPPGRYSKPVRYPRPPVWYPKPLGKYASMNILVLVSDKRLQLFLLTT